MNIKLKNCILSVTGIPQELAVTEAGKYAVSDNDVVKTDDSSTTWIRASITMQKNDIVKITASGTTQTPTIIAKYTDGTIVSYNTSTSNVGGDRFIAANNCTLYVNSNSTISIISNGKKIDGDIVASNIVATLTSSKTDVRANVTLGDKYKIITDVSNADVANLTFSQRNSSDSMIGTSVNITNNREYEYEVTDATVAAIQVRNNMASGSNVSAIYIVKVSS